MPQISDNVIGVNFEEVILSTPSRKRRFRTGTQCQGDDGRRYQYAIAGGAIAAGLATVGITLSGGVYTAAATGGTATNTTGFALTTGQYAWFRLP